MTLSWYLYYYISILVITSYQTTTDQLGISDNIMNYTMESLNFS